MTSSMSTPVMTSEPTSVPFLCAGNNTDDVICSNYGLNNSGNSTFPQIAPDLPYYIFVYVTALNLIILLVGVVGNVMVIIVVFKVKNMRSPMNFYLVSLSVADLLVLLICQPSALMEFYAKSRWYLSEAACKLVPYLEHLVLHASTLIILIITCERYYAICRPLQNNHVFHKPRPILLIFIMWAVSMITSLPFVFMTHLTEAVFVDGSPCYVCTTSVNRVWHYVYIVAVFVVYFIVPLTILSIMYGGIIRKLYADTIKLKDQVGSTEFYRLRSRKQVVRMLISIIVYFFMALLPLRVVILWKISSPSESIGNLGMEWFYNIMWFARIMMYTNSAGNPVIYSLFSTKFKMAFKRILHIYSSDASRHKTSVSARYTCFRSALSSANEHKIMDVKLNSQNGHNCLQVP